MTLKFYDTEIGSRLLIGTALYPSPQILVDAVAASGSKLVTVSVRREAARERAGQGFWEIIKNLDVHVLPNTAGCKTVKEAVTTAQMARELFETDWVKLEVLGDKKTLLPDPVGTLEACRELVADGFLPSSPTYFAVGFGGVEQTRLTFGGELQSA